MGENEGPKVEARVAEAKEPYVKIFFENDELKIEHNCPNFGVALGLTLDGLPYIFQYHIAETKEDKGVILSPAMAILPGAKVL